MIKFVASEIELTAAAGEESPRTVSGVAVPFNTVATVSGGQRVKFLPGAFNLSARPKLLESHDMSQLRGVVTSLAETSDALMFEAKFAKTRAADDAIELVKAGAYDSVSVGADPVQFAYDDSGTMIVSKADLVEISLVAMPAFKDAVITEIAASEPEPDEESQPDIPEEDQMSNENPVIEAEAPTIPTQPLLVAAAPARPFTMPSAAEYVSKLLAGGPEFAEFNARLRAAAPDVTTADSTGILPEPIVGAVYNNFRGLRPVIDAIGVKALPQGGKVFRRPYVSTHTTIGASNGENVALDAGQFIISEHNVTKGVYGGYVKLSEEDMDWTSPEVLGLLIDDMGRIYANETDNVAADALVTGATQTINFDDANYDDPSTWADWVYAAAAAILAGSNGNLPTHIFVDPLMWRRLGRLSDSSKRPLFPQVGPMNAFGSMDPGTTAANAFGLTVVVDRNFADNTLIVGDPSGFELYEQQKGAMSVESSDGSLSRIIKFRGYFATLMMDAQKFRKAAIV